MRRFLLTGMLVMMLTATAHASIRIRPLVVFGSAPSPTSLTAGRLLPTLAVVYALRHPRPTHD